MVLAVPVGFLVLPDRVKHVHWEAHFEQVIVADVDDVREQFAVVVEEEEGWKSPGEVFGESRVQEELQRTVRGGTHRTMT